MKNAVLSILLVFSCSLLSQTGTLLNLPDISMEVPGNIDPPEVNSRFNLPAFKAININLRDNYVSKRLMHTRNTFRTKGYEIDSFFAPDGSISFNYKITTLVFKIKNITEINYCQSGVRGRIFRRYL